MPTNINTKNIFISSLLSSIQHYNHKKYWKRRLICTSPLKVRFKFGSFVGGGILLIHKLLCLLYVKRCDAYNKASTGADLFRGALFATPPRLPHGLNGIIINPYAIIGENCRIYHQVTLGDDGKFYKNAPIIGDNVTIGPGAKVLGKIKIGNNAIIGANAVVVEDVPDNAIVVAHKARIIQKEK